MEPAGSGSRESVFHAFQSASAGRSGKFLHWPPSMLSAYLEMLRKEMGPAGLVLIMAGGIGLLRGRRWSAFILLTLPALCLLGLQAFWHQNSYRYALGIFVFVYPVAGLGLWYLVSLAQHCGELVFPRLRGRAAPFTLGLLCAILLVQPARIVWRTPPSGGIARTEATRFRADISRLAGPNDLVLIDLDRNTTLFCSSAYWLDSYVFSPFSTGNLADGIISAVLASGGKVLLMCGSEEAPEKSDALLNWAVKSWPVDRVATTEFGVPLAVWQVTTNPPERKEDAEDLPRG